MLRLLHSVLASAKAVTTFSLHFLPSDANLGRGHVRQYFCRNAWPSDSFGVALCRR